MMARNDFTIEFEAAAAELRSRLGLAHETHA
jgi:hypothetical protein